MQPFTRRIKRYCAVLLRQMRLTRETARLALLARPGAVGGYLPKRRQLE